MVQNFNYLDPYFFYVESFYRLNRKQRYILNGNQIAFVKVRRVGSLDRSITENDIIRMLIAVDNRCLLLARYRMKSGHSCFFVSARVCRVSQQSIVQLSTSGSCSYRVVTAYVRRTHAYLHTLADTHRDTHTYVQLQSDKPNHIDIFIFC